MRRWWQFLHGPRRRWWLWSAAIVVGLVVLIGVATLFVDEPIRRYVQYQMNQRLDGYTVSIGRADFHPIGLSVDFEKLLVAQDAHPDPPVARIGRISASVHWRALVKGAVVANFEIVRPVLHVDLTHVRQEAADERPVEKRGWQDALEAMYPLKINEFRIRQGQVTYVDRGPFEPLRVTGVEFKATNIRNVFSPDRVYPSTVWLEGVVFERGKLSVNGHADFMAEPHPGIKAVVAMDGIDLTYFKPILARYKLALRQGVLSAAGDVEYAPSIKTVRLRQAVLDHIEADYLHTQPEEPKVKQAAKTAARKTEEVTNKPGLTLRVDELHAVGVNVGVINKTAKEEYRVFLADTDLTVENLSNKWEDGPGVVKLAGKFMGSGATVVTATFRPELSGPDFDVNVRIEDTQVVSMNKLLRAHGKFDVVSGFFSLFSELRVKNGQIAGYVKPLFRNLDVYDPDQDRDKGMMRKLYEKVVGGVARLLENLPRDEVATKADIAGPVEDPKASTWQVVVRLIQNAFFKAILPGFEREVGSRRR